MDVIDRLIAAVKRSGYKRVRIAADAGMRPEKLSKILNRKQVPTVPEFIAIARAIRMDPARLFTDSELVVELDALRAAHAASVRVTETLAGMLPDAPSITPIPKPAHAHDAVPVRAAANPNAELLVEYESVRKQIPRDAWNRGAKIVARVAGDSMDGGADPIRDGELAYLKPTRSRRTAANKIVLLRRDDGLYLKLFEMSGHTIRLVSTNGSPAIVLDARHENLQIYGYVVGHG